MIVHVLTGIFNVFNVRYQFEFHHLTLYDFFCGRNVQNVASQCENVASQCENLVKANYFPRVFKNIELVIISDYKLLY